MKQPMKSYDTYKDSGVDWIGRIPSHWATVPMKHYFYMKGRIGWQGLKADEFIDEGPYLVTGTDFENGKVVWERCYHISQQRFEEAPEIHVNVGDLLITKDGTVGKLAYIDEKPEKVSLNSHLLILRPIKDCVENKFIYWALQSDQFDIYKGLAQSGSIMESLSQEKIGNYIVSLPPLKEQQAIAEYLDGRCAEIDSMVEKAERKVALLEEYRQSVITEAVTHGLNPDLPLRPSGIDWLGDIPQHWNLMPLKFQMDLNNGSDYKHIIAEEGYPVIGSGGVFAYANDFMYDGEVLMLGRKGTVDRPLYFNGKFWAVDTMFYAIPHKNTSCKYFYYQALGIPFSYYATATAVPSMTQTDLGNHIMMVPPISEQQAIASYLDEKCAKIDAQIAVAMRRIELLKELKQTVISDAVTGKVKVTND